MIRSRPFLDQSFCVFAFLFGLALFTSKSLISLTTVVLILLAALDPELRRIWSRNTWLIGLLCLFPLALFVNYFSLAGVVGVTKVTVSWYWPLLAAPFFCIYQSKKTLQYVAVGFTLGLVLALVKAGVNLFALAQVTQWFQYPVENMRIASFWDLGRWGFFSGLAVLCLFCFVNEKLSQRTRILSVLLLLFTVCFFVLANARGPLVGLTVAVLLVAVTDRKIFKSACLLFLVFGLYYALNSTVASRMKSIFAVSLQPNQITSTDKSNAGRLQMWKVAFDFLDEQPWFGTGFDQSTVPLKSFLDRQDPEYIKKYASTQFSYSDQHSSYISTLIQMGFVFSLACWGLVLFLTAKEFKFYVKTRDHVSRFCLAALAYCFVVFLFYSAFLSYEGIAFFALLTLTTRSKLVADRNH